MGVVFRADSTPSWADWRQRADRSVHVWRIPLLAEPERVRRLQCVLSSAERQRGERFATGQLARRFTVCRAATRLILAEYVGVEGKRLEFGQNRDGKPYLGLALGGDAASTRYNVSHSEDLAVLAVAWEREVGVDVEAIRPMGHLDRMVRRCLGPSERRAFYGDPTADRVGLFLRYWTHKEAYVKAIGTGLRTPLDSVEFDFTHPGRAPVVAPAAGVGRQPAPIQVVSFVPDQGYCGALAVEGVDAPEVRYWVWRGAG